MLKRALSVDSLTVVQRINAYFSLLKVNSLTLIIEEKHGLSAYIFTLFTLRSGINPFLLLTDNDLKDM
jgi:hypothetical protein